MESDEGRFVDIAAFRMEYQNMIEFNLIVANSTANFRAVDIGGVVQAVDMYLTSHRDIQRAFNMIAIFECGFDGIATCEC